MFGQTQTVERLIQGGANVNQQDKVRNMTVLHNVYGGHYTIRHCLVHGMYFVPLSTVYLAVVYNRGSCVVSDVLFGQNAIYTGSS